MTEKEITNIIFKKKEEGLTEEEKAICDEIVRIGKENDKHFLNYYFTVINCFKEKKEKEDYYRLALIKWQDLYFINGRFSSFREFLENWLLEQKELKRKNEKISEKSKDYIPFFRKEAEKLYKEKDDFTLTLSINDIFNDIISDVVKTKKNQGEPLDKIEYHAFKMAKDIVAEEVKIKCKPNIEIEEKPSRLSVTGPIYDDDDKPVYHCIIDGIRYIDLYDYREVEKLRKELDG